MNQWLVLGILAINLILTILTHRNYLRVHDALNKRIDILYRFVYGSYEDQIDGLSTRIHKIAEAVLEMEKSNENRG